MKDVFVLIGTTNDKVYTIIDVIQKIEYKVRVLRFLSFK